MKNLYVLLGESCVGYLIKILCCGVQPLALVRIVFLAMCRSFVGKIVFLRNVSLCFDCQWIRFINFA